MTGGSQLLQSDVAGGHIGNSAKVEGVSAFALNSDLLGCVRIGVGLCPRLFYVLIRCLADCLRARSQGSQDGVR